MTPLFQFAHLFLQINGGLFEQRSTRISVDGRWFRAEWASSKQLANAHAGAKLVHSVLTVALLSVRNWWVALTAVLRSYVAAQTTQVSELSDKGVDVEEWEQKIFE